MSKDIEFIKTIYQQQKSIQVPDMPPESGEPGEPRSLQIEKANSTLI